MDFLEYEKTIEKLEKSPIYVMSLGSKELFHSNLWAYLMKHDDYKSFINVFFKDLDLSLVDRIKREYENRDITIILGDGKKYAIENKIKSYATKEQLEKYSEKIECGVLTGIVEPSFQLPKGWSFISHKKIEEGLREINQTKIGFLHDVVENYCDVLISINSLLTECLDSNKGRLSYSNEKIDCLYKIKLLDVFKKLKADDFIKNACSGMSEHYNDLIKDFKNIEFSIGRGFNHGKATLDFCFYTFKDLSTNRELSGSIGVQIEENQFRLIRCCRDKKSNEIFQEYCEKKWFDGDYNVKNKLVFDNKTKMSKDYCQYNDNWVYQYFDIVNEDGVDFQTYDQLVGLLHKYLDIAFEIIKNEIK